MKASTLLALACLAALGCRQTTADPVAPPAAPSPDAQALHALDYYEPSYKIDANGRVVRLRLEWRHLPKAVLLEVATLTELHSMELSNSTVTDDGLAQLRVLPNLRALSIVNTPITDQGLAYLEEFPALEYLWLSKARISERALDKLKEARPDLHVYPL